MFACNGLASQLFIVVINRIVSRTLAIAGAYYAARPVKPRAGLREALALMMTQGPSSRSVHPKAIDTAYQYGGIVNHAAGINSGNCFAYACERAYCLKIAFKGYDVIHIDRERDERPTFSNLFCGLRAVSRIVGRIFECLIFAVMPCLEAMDEARHEVDYRRVEVITGRRRRRNWTDDEKARILEESAEPDANISAVARRWGVNRGLLEHLAARGRADAPHD